MDLSQSTFSSLNQRDAVLSIVLRLTQAGNLGTHLLRNSQTSSVIASAVDLVAGRELLQVLGQSRRIGSVVTVGIHCHNIMLNTHKVFPPIKI